MDRGRASEDGSMTARTLGLAVMLFSIGLTTAAPAQQPPAGAEASLQISGESAAESIDRAEAARQLATERRTEWLDTRGLIEQAREEARLGNYRQAVALADEARRQGELAVEQAEREAEAWQQRVVR